MASITDQQHAISHSAPGQAESPAIAPDEAGVASLDKVRDILFGGQMRELDRRFGKVEARLGSETAELREDLRRRLAALEQFARAETEALVQRIRTEHDERTAAGADAVRALQDASGALDRRIAGLDDQLAHVQREIRQQILEVEQRLTDEIRGKLDAVLARLNREADDLRHDKADRMTLAALFTEMAVRLTHEPVSRSEQE